MDKTREALKLALENSHKSMLMPGWTLVRNEDFAAIREALAEQPAQQEPVAWRFTGIAGLKRYMTQKHYDAQTPETKKWYEPFRCANCTTSPSASKPLTDEQLADCVPEGAEIIEREGERTRVAMTRQQLHEFVKSAHRITGEKK